MSDLPIDPTGAAGAAPGEPSEEEVRQYLAQMRGAPAEQVLAEVLQGLLNAAQVKLGRADARLLLDAAADVVDRIRPHVSGDLSGQVDDVLSQLRMAQVQAEQEVAESGREEPNDLASGGAGATPEEPADPAAAPQPGPAPRPGPDGPGAGGPGGAGGSSPLDKLWIPGR